MTNMQLWSMFLSLMSFIMVLLLSGNLYFVKRLINTVYEVKETMTAYKIIIETEKAKNDIFRDGCQASHDHIEKDFAVVNTRLNEHSKTLKEHAAKLTIHEEKLKGK